MFEILKLDSTNNNNGKLALIKHLYSLYRFSLVVEAILVYNTVVVVLIDKLNN